MSHHLIAATEADARALDAKVQAHLRATVPGYNANAWSDILSDGTRFAIVFEDRIAPALTVAELGTVVVGEGKNAVTTHAKVIDTNSAAEKLVPKTWAKVVKAEPVIEPL